MSTSMQRESCCCTSKTKIKKSHILQHCKSPIHRYKIQITKRRVKVAQLCLFVTTWTIQSTGFSRPKYWIGQPFPSPGYLPTHGSNPGLPHCRQILYQLSHMGCPRILEWIAYPFSRGSSPPRNRTRVSCMLTLFPSGLSDLGCCHIPEA